MMTSSDDTNGVVAGVDDTNVMNEFSIDDDDDDADHEGIHKNSADADNVLEETQKMLDDLLDIEQTNGTDTDNDTDPTKTATTTTKDASTSNTNKEEVQQQGQQTTAPAPAPATTQTTSSTFQHPLQDSGPPQEQQQQQPPQPQQQQSQQFIQDSVTSFASQISSFAKSASTQMEEVMSSTFQPTEQQVIAQQQQQQMQQQQAGQQPSSATTQYSNDEITALIYNNVGDLLPGERMVMFLGNVLNVVDTTTMIAGTNVPSNVFWCCAMTYYRIILFPTSTEKDSSTKVLIQMPLGSIDGVEKTVYTTSATNQQVLEETNSTSKTKSKNPVKNMMKKQTSSSVSSASSSNNNLASGAGAGSTTTVMGLVITGKDNGRQIRFTTPSYADTLRVHEQLQTYAFPGKRNLGYLFAFESKRSTVLNSVVTDPVTQKKTITLQPTRQRYKPLVEFTRQGILDNDEGGTTPNSSNPSVKPWSLWTNINNQYQLSSSYPSIIVGPTSLFNGIGDMTSAQDASAISIIRQCSTFRSEQRIPALTWGSAVGGGSLWRCSQPKVGIQGNRNSADEQFVQHIAQSAASANLTATMGNPHASEYTIQDIINMTGSTDKEYINPQCLIKLMDLRPVRSAMANRTKGYGHENTQYYRNSSLSFCGIGNIHAVRDAYQQLSILCTDPNTPDVDWMASVEKTKWMQQIRLLLCASWQVAFYIHVHKLPVLIHCSHGWDRASQVSALSQILLDPYYRTLEGFATLVEKDFMSFGHPFHTRSAHGEGKGELSKSKKNSSTSTASSIASNFGQNITNDDETSPIFLQFLDCVYQLVHLYPDKFEFNTKYLLIISEHVYSCRFGTMLCDNEQSRELAASIRQRTHSLWDYIDDERKAECTNYMYNDKDAVLWMTLPSLLRNVTLWVDRHCMYSPKETLIPLSLQAKNEMMTVSSVNSSNKDEGNEDDKKKNKSSEHDQQSQLRTSDDEHYYKLLSAQKEIEKWKQIAKEREEELNALKEKA